MGSEELPQGFPAQTLTSAVLVETFAGRIQYARTYLELTNVSVRRDMNEVATVVSVRRGIREWGGVVWILTSAVLKTVFAGRIPSA